MYFFSPLKQHLELCTYPIEGHFMWFAFKQILSTSYNVWLENQALVLEEKKIKN